MNLERYYIIDCKTKNLRICFQFVTVCILGICKWGGIVIQHGFSTIIAAHYIGKNLWINQQVTIGYSDATHAPYIGDNVRVCAGAKIIGGIRIGNNVTIGAGAIVVKDVPDNCTVVGNPAFIVKRDGQRVNIKL